MSDEREGYSIETLKLAYREALEGFNDLTEAYYRLDPRFIAILTVSSTVLGLAPALDGAPSPNVSAALVWVAAGCGWLYALYHCFRALRGGDFLALSPRLLSDPAWLGLPERWYLIYAIKKLAEGWERNAGAYEDKTEGLKYALIGLAFETLGVAVALLVF